MVSVSFLPFLASYILCMGLGTVTANNVPKRKPNIVFILSDDQDKLLGSLDFMPTVQNELISKGVQFSNFHTTSAQCCPSRTTMLRGQAAHNTNVTSVFAPGGNYEKFMLAGHSENYLPHWLRAAGYRTEYIGKFLNGVNLLNWHIPPAGWNYIDYFVEPYQTTPNNVVMSRNGETPIAYLGYHQTDVVRAKALDRLDYLINNQEPFFLWLSPTAPHVDDETSITVPCARHMDLFPNATAPRSPNWNPPDEIQQQMGGFLKNKPLLSVENQTWVDGEYRRRAQSLMGIDEMVADVIDKLEKEGVLENTYIIYTSDNGYHLGNHRLAAGKATAYAEDTNLPLIIRGPGIPSAKTSSLPGAMLDFPPTLLEIAGLPKNAYPPFLDGRSMLPQWRNPDMRYPSRGKGTAREILNVEYWGKNAESIPGGKVSANSTYKALRIVGDKFAYLYTQWCYTNEVELFDTINDPHEITNLARTPTKETSRLLTRLNAMLLVQKSCSTNTCRNPWTILLSNSSVPRAGTITSLTDAMNPIFDAHFASFPKANIAACTGYQDAALEAPFLPAEAESLGSEFRKSTEGLGPSFKFSPRVPENDPPAGGIEQRYAGIEEIMGKSRELNAYELDKDQPRVIRSS